MGVKLQAREAGEGEPVILLHGLFGSGGNLGALARHLQVQYRVISLDLPGHGRSDWLPDYTLPLLAEQVTHWMTQQHLSSAHFVGHSLGGKVAMQLALAHPAQVRSLVVADIAPVTYPRSHDAVFNALNAVDSAHCNSRTDAQALMEQHLVERDVIQFLLGSLRADGEGIYRWRMDVAGLERDYDALLAPPHSAAAWPGPVLFIKGADSDYLQEQYRPAIEHLFPQAQLKIMRDSGHWLHAQNPQLFNGIVARFLEDQASRPEAGATA